LIVLKPIKNLKDSGLMGFESSSSLNKAGKVGKFSKVTNWQLLKEKIKTFLNFARNKKKNIRNMAWWEGN
jgi:uncharacterized cupredoxin-like copper-binding protein